MSYDRPAWIFSDWEDDDIFTPNTTADLDEVLEGSFDVPWMDTWEWVADVFWEDFFVAVKLLR